MTNPVTLARKRKYAPIVERRFVQQFTLDGQLVNEWRFCSEIARVFHVSRNRVTAVLKKEGREWRGFIWKYVVKELPRYSV